jgi:hypothetical protein
MRVEPAAIIVFILLADAAAEFAPCAGIFGAILKTAQVSLLAGVSMNTVVKRAAAAA